MTSSEFESRLVNTRVSKYGFQQLMYGLVSIHCHNSFGTATYTCYGDGALATNVSDLAQLAVRAEAACGFRAMKITPSEVKKILGIREALDIKQGNLILFETMRIGFAGRGSVQAQDPCGPAAVGPGFQQ